MTHASSVVPFARTSSAMIEKKQRRIFSVLQSVDTLPRTSLHLPKGDYSEIEIKNQFGFFPDFVFEWCSSNEHYRVYIHVGSREWTKEQRAGYNIMVVGSKLAAATFCMIYSAFHRYRANSKE